ncbi:SRPBCC family protein [Amycolatopsis samaneae]|uniref:SRPBCC family protein n=1 Tax=Amycolatopsis samaneae TaxID=664691 RepID=A0ABW5GRM2_9PSEU
MTELIHEIHVPASADSLLELVADQDNNHLYYPTHLYAEVVGRDGNDDLVDRWVIDGEQVKSWRIRRTIDREGRKIVFTHVEPAAPFETLFGEWTFRPDGDTGTLVRTRHGFDIAGNDAATIKKVSAHMDHNVPEVLKHTSWLAVHQDRLRELTFTAERTARVTASLDEVYRYLADGDTSDEKKYARVLQAPNRILHKWRTGLPGDLYSLTGEYRLTQHGAEVEVLVGNTIVLPVELDGDLVEKTGKKVGGKSDKNLQEIVDHFAAKA